jgi:hypothetical protein
LEIEELLNRLSHAIRKGVLTLSLLDIPHRLYSINDRMYAKLEPLIRAAGTEPNSRRQIFQGRIQTRDVVSTLATFSITGPIIN